MSLSDKITSVGYKDIGVITLECEHYRKLLTIDNNHRWRRPEKFIQAKDVKEAIKELKLVIRQKLINTFPDIDMEKYLETAKIEFFDEIDKIFGEKLT